MMSLRCLSNLVARRGLVPTLCRSNVITYTLLKNHTHKIAFYSTSTEGEEQHGQRVESEENGVNESDRYPDPNRMISWTWRNVKKFPTEQIINKVELGSGARLTIMNEEQKVVFNGNPRSVGKARDLLFKYLANIAPKPHIVKVLPKEEEMVKFVSAQDEKNSNYVNIVSADPSMQGKQDEHQSTHEYEAIKDELERTTDLPGEMQLIGRFGLNTFFNLPEGVSVDQPVKAGDVLLEDYLTRSKFVANVPNEGMLASMSGEESETLDIRLLTRIGVYRSILLRLAVVDGKLQPNRALFPGQRTCIDFLNPRSGIDLRLSTHFNPKVNDESLIMEKIDTYFSRLKIFNNKGVRVIRTLGAPDFHVTFARLKKKKSFMYKNKYNIDVCKVYSYHASNSRYIDSAPLTQISFDGEPTTEVEVSNTEWNTMFDENMNLSAENKVTWTPQTILDGLPDFTKAVSDLALLLKSGGKKE